MKVFNAILYSILALSMLASTHCQNIQLSQAVMKVKDWQIQAQDGKSVFGYERELGSIWQNSITCTACHLTMGPLDWFLAKEFVYKNLEKLGYFICVDFVGEDSVVCKGAVTDMGDILVPQLTSMLMTPEYSCSRLFGFCSSPHYVTENSQTYINRMMSEKPDIIKNNEYIDNLYKEIKDDPKERETIKILHMSDLHMDLEYTVGNNKNCDEPLCCMSTNGPAPTPEDAAREFGEYECDMPIKTLETLFHYVRDMDEADKPDLVLWTGDNVAHDIWNQTVHKNTESTNLITDFIKSHWEDMPVFVTPGNHEFYPVNVESFNENQPILERLAEHWIDWIDEDDLEQFKKYGYYSIPLKSVSEDLSHVKVITLNTQAANDLNWGLLTTLSDPGNQLAWLEEELKECEANNLVVYILGHIPPSTSLSEWSIRYKALVERFQHVIRYQGFGHDHEENVYVVRGTYDFKPISSYHLASSVTTFTGINPSFRIMEVDKETMLPLKMYTHFLNITRANDEGKATWETRYEFTEAYEMEDLSPSSIFKMSLNFFEKPELAVKFLKNKAGQGGPNSDLINDCDQECIRQTFCHMNSANKMLEKDCLGEPRQDFIRDLKNGDLTEYLFDPWVEKLS